MYKIINLFIGSKTSTFTKYSHSDKTNLFSTYDAQSSNEVNSGRFSCATRYFGNKTVRRRRSYLLYFKVVLNDCLGLFAVTQSCEFIKIGAK